MPGYDYTISSFTLPNGTTVEIKDEVARNAQQSGMHYIGVSTDESLVDGYTTAAIAISGKAEAVTAVAGDIATKGYKEYLFDGSAWHPQKAEGCFASVPTRPITHITAKKNTHNKVLFRISSARLFFCSINVSFCRTACRYCLIFSRF